MIPTGIGAGQQNPHRLRRIVPALAGAAMAMANAAAQAQAAAPKAIEGPSFTPMALALVLVLGLIGAAVWVLRRTGIAPRAGSSQLRLVTQLALGPRERVVVVEAGERWLVLGVGAGGITRLGTMPKAESAVAGTAPPPSFGALLDKLRGGTR
jgi:flagellar protein FliO/FliZ